VKRRLAAEIAVAHHTESPQNVLAFVDFHEVLPFYNGIVSTAVLKTRGRGLGIGGWGMAASRLRRRALISVPGEQEHEDCDNRFQA
jgi:hypothetical protein